ncbi:MAG: hypothetical protein EXQ81_06065 [Thermoleophilia bacterium]|nr:hypothetical protein [Thermoleophilia bacterium]
MELGKGFWLRTCGTVIGIGVLCLIGLVIFDRLIYRFGAIAALVIVFAILMAIAYRADRKKAHRYDESDS